VTLAATLLVLSVVLSVVLFSLLVLAAARTALPGPLPAVVRVRSTASGRPATPR
jgi:hypothetical protein